ncbi:MAG: MiaB/RimO family radical SAM methylthiotransferase [Acidimicrobiales bacterium]
MAERFFVETLGCPKNQVDSDKLVSSLLAAGLEPADALGDADLVVVNTCAFIEAARAESIEVILDVTRARRTGSRLVVTGCLAARAGAALAEALPEVDSVADVGIPVHLGGARWRPRSGRCVPAAFLDLARPRARAPWAYVKIAEGCDRRCGFCAIPQFRGPQRSRDKEAILSEIGELGAIEVVLVAQDLASYGRDLGRQGGLVDLVGAVAARGYRVRLLYLYPASLDDHLIDTIVATGIPYFDLSLQHVSRPLLRRMRRWGSQEAFCRRIDAIRSRAPEAALRSSFILGYPGETEEDHDALLAFLRAAELDWAGFFTFSEEEGTYAATLDDRVPREVALERLRESAEVQDEITARRRRALVGTAVDVLVDAVGVGRSHREAPEIDGVIHLPAGGEPGTLRRVRIDAAQGPDLEGSFLDGSAPHPGRPMASAGASR